MSNADAQVAGPDETEGGSASLLPQCRRLARAGSWPELRMLTDDDALLLAQPRLLVFRLAAAEALADAALFADIGRVAARLPNDSPVKMSLLRDMAKAGQGDIVAQMLLDDHGLRGHPRFFKLTAHVLRNTKSKALRAQYKASAIDASNGGMAMAPVASDFVFDARPPGPYALGNVALTAGAAVPDHHLPGLQEQVRLFRAGIDKAIKSGAAPSLEEYHDVFTDRNGQIWTEAGAIIRSKGRPLASVTRDAVPNLDCAMMSQSATRGIYHWLVDRVPRFAWLKVAANAAQDTPILISDVAPRFEMACMEMLGLAAQVRPVGDAVFVRRLVIPNVGFRNMVGWEHVDWGLRTLIDAAMATAREAEVDLPARIYISRRDAKRRSLTNESALEADLEQRGFVSYLFSEIPIWHQIALIHSARVVMGPHGAGLSHLIFARPGTKVVEIIPIKDGTYQLRFNYARLSIIKGLDYHGWIEEQKPGVNGWTLDREPFLAFADRTLNAA